MIHKPHWLVADIDVEMLRKVERTLRKAKGAAVKFYLSSGGGDQTIGLAIVDLLTSYKGHVTITVIGSAESMAAIILQAADTRLITASSYLMLHSGTIDIEGRTKDVKANLRIIDFQDDLADQVVLRRILKKKPNYTWARFRAETNHDTYFSAEKALEWNLVDKISK